MSEPSAPNPSPGPQGVYQSHPATESAAVPWLAGKTTVLLLLACMLLLPALPGRFSPTIPFNPANRQELAQKKPTFVFIGNSMLFSRIDLPTLNTLPGATGMLLSMGGVFSAHWYLWLKNDLIASGHRPRATFLFFRDDELTTPYRSVSTPEERALLAKASVDDEPELQRVLAFHRPFIDRLETFFYDLYPIQLKRNDLDWSLDSLALLPALPDFPGMMWRKKFGSPPVTPEEEYALFASRQEFKREIKETLFNANGFRPRPAPRPATDAQTRPAPPTFAEQLPHSLLPAMLRLAKEHGLRLEFVLVKQRPNLDGAPLIRPDYELRYLADLRDYLAAHGAGLHDDNPDDRWTPEHYYDQWHIAPRFKALYTQRFVAGKPDIFAPRFSP
ncbi:MAG: hypothetical protein HQL96_11775 [Magnetococcales bacterium]|nr:hypothetical protein [Magnetococcales bacterium]